MREIKSSFAKKERLIYAYIPLMFVFILLFAITFLCIDYSDGRESFITGYSLGKSFLIGDLGKDFLSYEYTYGFFYYFIIAIWSLPIILLDRYCGVEGFENILDMPPFHIIWYKLLLLLAAIVCAIYFYKIVCKILHQQETNGNERLNHLPFSFLIFFITSPCFVFFPFAITQCDIVNTSFILICVYYLCFEHNDVKASIFMAFSVAIKYFSGFIFVPILIIKYIRKPKKLLIMSLPTIILAGISLTIHYFHFYLKPVGNEVSDLALNRAKGAFSNIPFMVLFGVLLSGIIYLKIKKEYFENRINEWIFYFGFIFLAILYIFYHSQVYWIILLEPFIIICCVLKGGALRHIILETAFVYDFTLLRCIENEFFVLGNSPFHMLLLKDYEYLKDLSGINFFWHVITDYYGVNTKLIIFILYVILFALFALCVIEFFPNRKRNREVVPTQTTNLYLWFASLIHVITIVCCFVIEGLGRYVHYK